MAARNVLIEHNLRLVAHVAKKYQSQEYENDDLISIGIIGLIKAVSTFDSGKNSRLATYAARCCGPGRSFPGRCPCMRKSEPIRKAGSCA